MVAAGQSAVGEGRVDEAIMSYLKAQDIRDKERVVLLAKEQRRWAALVPYLKMVKKFSDTPSVAAELAAAESNASASREQGR